MKFISVSKVIIEDIIEELKPAGNLQPLPIWASCGPFVYTFKREAFAYLLSNFARLWATRAVIFDVLLFLRSLAGGALQASFGDLPF